jgi:hypothetical protein
LCLRSRASAHRLGQLERSSVWPLRLRASAVSSSL